MQNLKYYVLWKKDSPLLKEYLDKFYNKLLLDLLELSNYFFENNFQKNSNIIKSLLNTNNNRGFILNGEISSIVNYLFSELIKWKNEWLWDYRVYLNRLIKEINIFLDEWIESEKLNLNKWTPIGWTDIKLVFEDNNPYNKLESDPEHHLYWAHLWWWEKSKEEWLNVYEKTFYLLRRLSPDIYDELNQIITKIVPLWTAIWMHNSASYKECIGHLYMWYTVDSNMPEINNLEAIIHESSHNKLNLIAQFDEIVLNWKEFKYYSAIRPDARPLYWVFLWVYAFAPTIYILSEAIKKGIIDDESWLQKCVLYAIKTKFLYRILFKHAKFSELGKEIFDEIKYVISLIDKNLLEIKPSKEIFYNAKRAQIQHFSEVNGKYPNLEC